MSELEEEEHLLLEMCFAGKAGMLTSIYLNFGR